MSDFDYGFEQEPEMDMEENHDAAMYEEWEPETISVEQWNLLQGVNQLVLFGVGYKAYQWYVTWVDDSFPERDDDATPIYRHDITWANSTDEIKAWTSIAEFMLVANSVHWTFWLLNYMFDNEGGDLHRVYNALNSISTLYPVVLG